VVELAAAQLVRDSPSSRRVNDAVHRPALGSHQRRLETSLAHSVSK